jgi:hypothetical protein
LDSRRILHCFYNLIGKEPLAFEQIKDILQFGYKLSATTNKNEPNAVRLSNDFGGLNRAIFEPLIVRKCWVGAVFNLK